MLDPRLKEIIIDVVDVSYGGQNGLSQAINLATAKLGQLQVLDDIRLLSSFFDHIARDTGRYCIGVRDTDAALEMGAVSTLIVSEEFECDRYVLRNSEGEERVMLLTTNEATDPERFRDAVTGEALDVLEAVSYPEWLSENYKSFGCELRFVSTTPQVGVQFARGMGGIGAILRYQVDFMAMFELEDGEYDDGEWNEEGL